MSKYILDLTDCKELPEYLKEFTKIPCIDGVNEFDFDTALSELPSNVISGVSDFDNNKGKPLPTNDVPLGFNFNQIPTGAKLIKI